MKYQFMPMFWGDFLANTLHLSAQEVGAYVLLIAHAWENDGKIPYDRLHRIARVNSYHWVRVWKQLEPFFEVERTSVGAPLLVHHRRVTIERSNAAELSNKRKGAAEQMLSKRSAIAQQMPPHTILQLPIEKLSNCKGSEATQAPVVPAAPVNWRDPGNDYRSPPARKPDLPPMTEEQRTAAMLLAAKTDQLKRRKDHERQTDDAESDADASAAVEAARTAAE